MCSSASRTAAPPSRRPTSTGTPKYARFWRPPITAWRHPATGHVPRHTSGHRAAPAGAGDHQRSHVLAFTGTRRIAGWRARRPAYAAGVEAVAIALVLVVLLAFGALVVLPALP